MVRSFILIHDQRKAIEDYLRDKPTIMTSQIRQLRLKVKKLAYEQMEYDLELLKRLRDLKIPKGRKNTNVAAGFNVRRSQEKEVGEVAAGFSIPEKPELGAGFTVKPKEEGK